MCWHMALPITPVPTQPTRVVLGEAVATTFNEETIRNTETSENESAIHYKREIELELINREMWKWQDLNNVCKDG